MLNFMAVTMAFLLFSVPGQAQTYKLRSAVGTNLAPITYWTTQIPFVDVMKSSSAWISGDSSKWDNQQPLDVDASGWVRSLAPGQIARMLTLREIGSHYPAGRYLVRYKGKGTLKFEFAARIVSEKQGAIVLQVTPSDGGIQMIVETTDPADYLRDIEIIMPGGICEGDPFTHISSARKCGGRRFLSFADNGRSILFYPVFLDRLRAYSVLRFVDWMQTDAPDNPVTRWSQRTPLSYRTWTVASGAPVELMIELANRIGAHPWFNMPHQSDDSYAQNFAQLVKAKLDPVLRVYVEHSNEVWNGQFPQYAYVEKTAAALIPALDKMQYHALRSRTLGEIFKVALGSERVVTVLAAQAGYSPTATRGLAYLKSRFGNAIGIDAVAIAPYIIVTPDTAEAQRIASMSLDKLFNAVRTTALPTSLVYVKNYRKIANDYGLRLISYEGGQHLVGIDGAQHNAELNILFHAFNRDPRIKDLYLEYLAGWKQAGGELFMHYTDVGKPSIWGSFGALEYIAQPRAAAPKFDALLTFIENNHIWWTQ